MLYNHLLIENFGTVKYILGLVTVFIRNLKERSMIVYLENAPEVKYTKKSDISCCFVSFSSALHDILYSSAEGVGSIIIK